MSDTQAVPPAIRTTRDLDHIGVSVPDLEAATVWYQRAFALTVASDFSVPGADLRGRMLLHETGFRIELLERVSARAGLRAAHPNEAALTHGYGHMCFRTDDVAAAFAELIAAGAVSRVEPCPSPRPGAMMAWVSDPFGNLIELIDRQESAAPGKEPDRGPAETD